MPGHRKLWGFSEQRLRRLQHQMRVKEERIAELETENAILHLKLAEYQERMNRSSHEAWPYALLRTRQCQQKLQQDVKELRSSFLVLLQSHQDEYQSCLSDIMAAVQGVQLSSEALRACQSEAAGLQRCLQELDSHFRLEQQRRRALHNSLVELKGNIRVHCRIRPFLSFDKESDGSASQNCNTPGEVAHAVDDVSSP
ncbi:kinesin-like protein KIF25 [Peromyscus eremicus]|uniref:kinesin-like protein KIF25 n=1 Tax=Peromyscus eremicus TaxID=42410 RepID=UPI0027DE097E|nr:kinesin-like protein KIF25 [Peromyscus eremicus]